MLRTKGATASASDKLAYYAVCNLTVWELGEDPVVEVHVQR